MLFVPRKLSIMAYQCITSPQCSRNNNTVERIRMFSSCNIWNRQVVECFHNIGGYMQNGNAVCLYNRTNLFGTVGFETTNLLQLNYFDKRNFRYCKLVLVVLDTVAQRFGKTTFIVRYKPYKGMRVKKIPHNSKPNGSGTSSLYLVSFTSFLGTGLKSLLSIFLDFLVLTDVVFILQFLFSNCNVNIIYLHNQSFEVFFKKKTAKGGIIFFTEVVATRLPCVVG